MRAKLWPKAMSSAADIFAAGDKVAVTGISKGKGFAGVMKRYGWRGNKATHGASTSHRKPASGGGTDAARTFKGSGKPGHMGDVQVTQQGLRVVRVDTEKNLLLVKGRNPRRERRAGHDQEIHTLRRNTTHAGNHSQKSRWHQRGKCLPQRKAVLLQKSIPA